MIFCITAKAILKMSIAAFVYIYYLHLYWIWHIAIFDDIDDNSHKYSHNHK